MQKVVVHKQSETSSIGRKGRAMACRLLEEAVKAMLTSLPLVSDLHHPAMRDRHWNQLMKVCYAALSFLHKNESSILPSRTFVLGIMHK